MNGKYYYIEKNYSLNEKDYTVITHEKCKDSKFRSVNYKTEDFVKDEKFFVFSYDSFERIINMKRLYDIKLVSTSNEIFLALYFNPEVFSNDNTDDFFQMCPDIFVFGISEIRRFSKELESSGFKVINRLDSLLNIFDENGDLK